MDENKKKPPLFIIGSGASAASADPAIAKFLGHPPLGNDMGEVILTIADKLQNNLDEFRDVIKLSDQEICQWQDFLVKKDYCRFLKFIRTFFPRYTDKSRYNLEFIWSLTEISELVDICVEEKEWKFVREIIKPFIIGTLRIYYSTYNPAFYKILGDYIIKNGCYCISYNWDNLLEKTILENHKKEFSLLFLYNALTQPAIIKPHGSINWQFKNNKVDYIDNPNITDCDNIYILPPTFFKAQYIGKNHTYKYLLDETLSSLFGSDTLMVIGYSFPSFDLETEYLFRLRSKKGVQINKVVILDPFAENIAARIMNFFPNAVVKFYPNGFSDIEKALKEIDE
jgi:hypothetical protein